MTIALRTFLVFHFAVLIAGCDAPLVQEVVDSAMELAEPGPLHPAHRGLGLKCDDCHTAVYGVEAAECVVCHALNGPLVQRQTTSFHAAAGDCGACHVEHVPSGRLVVPLDHELLASLAVDWHAAALETGATLGPHSRAAQIERLDCNACHENQDSHFGLLGPKCLDCHDTRTWDVDGYTHPSPRSQECAQCHQAPPSHYMKHFKMLSAKVARQPHAEVRECFACHLTTSWPDIRGVGFYKHH